MKPLAIDLFCGLGGWTEGAIAAGYEVVGFDIEVRPYPAQLVLQDILTCHGSQFRDANLILASPPCQNYSYLAMPWSRSKPELCECRKLMMFLSDGAAITGTCRKCGNTGFIEHSKAAKALRKKWETEGPDNRLFDACFRIQREAIEAAGRYIPLIVENVRGAQPWVGRAKASFGSYYLWGDVAMVGRRIVAGAPEFGAGMRPSSGFKGGNGSLFAIANNTNGHSQNPVHALTKVPGFRFDGSGGSFQTASVKSTRSNARKAASAQIAKIPFALARYVAESFRPK